MPKFAYLRLLLASSLRALAALLCASQAASLESVPPAPPAFLSISALSWSTEEDSEEDSDSRAASWEGRNGGEEVGDDGEYKTNGGVDSQEGTRKA